MRRASSRTSVAESSVSSTGTSHTTWQPIAVFSLLKDLTKVWEITNLDGALEAVGDAGEAGGGGGGADPGAAVAGLRRGRAAQRVADRVGAPGAVVALPLPDPAPLARRQRVVVAMVHLRNRAACWLERLCQSVREIANQSVGRKVGLVRVVGIAGEAAATLQQHEAARRHRPPPFLVQPLTRDQLDPRPEHCACLKTSALISTVSQEWGRMEEWKP